MNGYVKTIRAMIGHEPLILCGASVIVYREGSVLLQRRSDNGYWGYHGGCLEPGELLEDAARRELFEESGLTARSLTLFGVFSGPELHYVYPNGDEVYNVDTVFVCEDFSGDLQQHCDEVLEHRWFPLRALPENLSQPIVLPLRKFTESKLAYQHTGK